MQFRTLAKPSALFAAASMPASAFAVTIAVDYNPTVGGTAINIGGAATPQFQFRLLNSALGGTKTYIDANTGNDPGARIGFPNSPATYFTAQTAASGGKSPYSINGDYSLLFDIGNVAYSGTATVDQQGQHISSITYNQVGATAVVPEVSTWAMMVLGLGGAGAAMRRRRQSSAAVSA